MLPPDLSPKVLVRLSLFAALAASARPCWGAALSVREIPEPGRSFSVCADTATSCVADFHSTLEITPQLADVASGGAAPADPAAKDKRAGLIKALAAFTESMRLSAELNTKCRPASDTSAVCVGLQRDFIGQRIGMRDSLVQYVRHDTSSADFQRDADDTTIIRKLGPVYQDPAKIGEWIAGRIAVQDAESAKASNDLRARLKETRVRLGAFHSRGSKQPSPLHLEGYDEFEAKNIKTSDRISYTLTDEQTKRLEEEARFNQELATEIGTLRDRSSMVLKQLKARLTSIEASAIKARETLDAGLRTFDSGAQDDVAGLFAVLRASSSATAQARLSVAENELASARKRLSAYRDVADAARVTLEGLGRASGGRPDLALKGALDALETLRSDLDAKTAADLVASLTSLEKVKAALTAIPGDAAALNKTAAERLAAIEGRRVGQLLKTVADVEAILRDEVAAQYAFIDDFKNRVGKYIDGAAPILATDLSDPAIHTVAGDQAGATRLDLSTAGVDSGDEVELLLEVEVPGKDGKEGSSQKSRRRVRIERFGLSTSVTGGLAFVKSELTSQANFEPAPTMTWLCSWTGRPERRGLLAFLGRTRPGIGIHTVGLDFDPNNSVEVGMGVSFHFFRDILQFGYGMNLNIPRKRQYGFVGLRLFGMLKK